MMRVLELRGSNRTAFRRCFVSARWSSAVICIFLGLSHMSSRVSFESSNFLPVCAFRQNLIPTSLISLHLRKSSTTSQSFSSISNRLWSSIWNLSEPAIVWSRVSRSVERDQTDAFQFKIYIQSASYKSVITVGAYLSVNLSTRYSTLIVTLDISTLSVRALLIRNPTPPWEKLSLDSRVTVFSLLLYFTSDSSRIGHRILTCHSVWCSLSLRDHQLYVAKVNSL